MEYLKGLACLLFLTGVIILIFAVPYVAMTLVAVGVIVAILGAGFGRMWLRLARRWRESRSLRRERSIDASHPGHLSQPHPQIGV